MLRRQHACRFSGIDITASALNAQKTRLDIVAQNIANAQTTRTPSGGPYQRQVVSFEGELIRHSGGSALQSVRVGAISADRTPGQQVYNPQHPDAKADGQQDKKDGQQDKAGDQSGKADREADAKAGGQPGQAGGEPGAKADDQPETTSSAPSASLPAGG